MHATTDDHFHFSTPPGEQPGLRAALGLIVLYFALQMAVGLVAGVLIGLLLGLLHPGSALDGVGQGLANPSMQSAFVVTTLVGAAAITLWLAHRLWPRLWSQANPPGLGFAWPNARSCALGVLAGIVMPLLGGWLTAWLAHGHAVPQDVKQLGAGADTGLRIVLTLAVASIGPVVEELLFRGVLLSALLRHLRVAWAVLVSATLFALAHLMDLHGLWYALPNLLLLGVVLAWLRLRSGSLWPSVIAHAGNNLVAMLALFSSLHHG